MGKQTRPLTIELTTFANALREFLGLAPLPSTFDVAHKTDEQRFASAHIHVLPSLSATHDVTGRRRY